MLKDKNRISKFIKESQLFHNLSHNQHDQLIELIEMTICDEGEYVIKEGEAPTDIFVIMEGEVEIVKQSEGNGPEYQLAKLGKGDSLGEVSLLDSRPRSASVKALTTTILLKINIDDLARLSSDEESIHTKMTLNLAHEMGKRLRDTNTTAVDLIRKKLKDAEKRASIGAFLCFILIATTFFVFILGAIFNLKEILPSTILVLIPTVILFAIIIIIIIQKNGYKISNFGVTSVGWRQATFEGLVFTIPLLVIIFLIKWLIINYTNIYPEGSSIFSFGSELTYSLNTTILLFIGYALYAVLQEFIARGCIQGSLQNFLINKHREKVSILLATILFAMTHLHISYMIVIIIFIPGLFWGWLYTRHQSIIGVSLSHIITGIFAYYIVGFQQLLMIAGKPIL